MANAHDSTDMAEGKRSALNGRMSEILAVNRAARLALGISILEIYIK